MNENSTLLFLGDVVPYKPFRFKNNQKTVINLECPITGTGNPISGKINLRVKENFLESTFGPYLFAVSLGNNHILDYGLEGLNSTLNALESSGTPYFGINEKTESKHNPLIRELNGKKVAFFSVICESTNPLVEFDDFNYLSILSIPQLVKDIGKIRNSVDRIVVYIHWGEEESSYPVQKDIISGRELVDAGADIILGSHAHAPQAVERYKNGIIAYSLGNFIMPAFRNMPSYYDENGHPQSDFTKRLMFWNRISWGISVDMENLSFRVRKFLFMADRIIELRSTPLDRYLTLPPSILTEEYSLLREKHLQKREFRRKIRDFMGNPHIPHKLRKML